MDEQLRMTQLQTSNDGTLDLDESPSPLDLNPLLIDVTLRNILKFLRLEDLVKSRAVCCLWNEMALPMIQRRVGGFRIRITTSAQLTSFLDMEKQSSLTFSNFMIHPGLTQQFFSSPNPEVRSYTLRFDESDFPVKDIGFKDLIRNKLPSLQSLELIDVPCASTQEFAAEYDRSSASNSILGITRLLFHLSCPWASTPEISMFRYCLFQATPALKTLIVILDQVDFHSNTGQFHSIHDFGNFGSRPETLTEFELAYVDLFTMNNLATELSRTRLRRFVAKRFQIRAHTRHLEDGREVVEDGADAVTSFLNQHSATLEVLSLHFYGGEFQVQVPSMPKLESLELYYNCVNNPTQPNLGRFDYGLQFPKLRSLKIRFTFEAVVSRCPYAARSGGPQFPSPYPTQIFFTLASSPCPTLRELELPEHLNSPNELRNIERIFTNVRKLNLGAQTAEVTTTLWEIWPKLEVLAIAMIHTRTEDTATQLRLDALFNGYLSDQTSHPKFGHPLDFAHVDAFRTDPAIWTQRRIHLKYLILSSSPRYGPKKVLQPAFRISDATGYLSFTTMQSLQCLVIDSGLHMMSQECIQEICNTLELNARMSDDVLQFFKYDWQGTKVQLSLNPGEYPCVSWDEL